MFLKVNWDSDLGQFETKGELSGRRQKYAPNTIILNLFYTRIKPTRITSDTYYGVNINVVLKEYYSMEYK